MTDTFLDDLGELMPDTLIAEPGNLDGYGSWVASGAVLNIPCHIEGRMAVIQNPQGGGREMTSRLQVYTGEYHNLDADSYRYTLPARYEPNVDLRALYVEKYVDETGPLYEVVYFP